MPGQMSVDWVAGWCGIRTPVKLKRLAKSKGQRHKGLRRLALSPSPGTDKRGELAVATVITFGFDLRQQRLGTSPLLLGPQRIGF